jgi:long-chain acyl-CoA synthetase
MLIERDIREGDVMVHVGPMSHATGTYVLPHYLKGGTNIIMTHFDPDDFLSTVEKERVTTVMMVPTMVIRLLSCDVKKYNLKSLRKIMYGAAPMPVARLKEAIQIFGNIFSQGYGLTEAPMTVATLKERDHFVEGKEELTRRLSAAGRPYLTVDVKIVDDDGQELPAGEAGEIIIKSDHVMGGYWKDPEATQESIRQGWLFSGDVGKFDEKGFLYIVDRKKDMLISGGFNIYPKEVEDAIYKHPAVKEVAVIGIPDAEWGESVQAVVVLKEGMKATPADIIDTCKDHLASYKKPRSVEFIDELPKNPYGKIQKKVLQEKYSKKGK